MSEYQGEKFRLFISELKSNYKEYGFSTKPTNEQLASMLGVSSVQLNRYYKSKSLERETVNKILSTFKVYESAIWGNIADQYMISDPVQKYNTLGNVANLWIVPFRAYAGFLRGYGDGLAKESDIEKIYYPLIDGEAYAFQVGGQSAFPIFPENTWFCGKPLESNNDLVKGRLYAWQTNDGIVLKVFDKVEEGKVYTHSINNDFNPVSPMDIESVTVIYRQVGKLDNFEY